MNTIASISVDDRSNAFIGAQIAQGAYRDPSEVVQAVLRLLEERDSKMSALREALVAGEESGRPEPFDLEDSFWPRCAGKARKWRERRSSRSSRESGPAEIWTYSVKRWGETRAHVYIAEFHAAAAKVATNLGISRAREDIRPGY